MTEPLCSAIILAIADADSQKKVLVDIGNFHPMFLIQEAMMRGEEPPEIDPAPVYAAIARVAPYAGIVHAKTNRFQRDGTPRDMDVVRALRIVRDTGYAGPISL